MGVGAGPLAVLRAAFSQRHGRINRQAMIRAKAKPAYPAREKVTMMA
ncbi:MAG: hypothetical protein CAPSK01_001047 [Candidatus Accumulibacter vicinus]|uniref:Uncharacterized protein n=1 Tax=Candidatus Accumulibacter vicinus TaxID=2954382 RepID=A0A084Y3K7_9PROT|nr:MAG: hypothetical protein CAPSK01_001047 [Candidatus Accumulibacter vicinus]